MAYVNINHIYFESYMTMNPMIGTHYESYGIGRIPGLHEWSTRAIAFAPKDSLLREEAQLCAAGEERQRMELQHSEDGSDKTGEYALVNI